MPNPSFGGKRFFSVFILTSLLLGLAVAVILTIRPFGAFETRRKAAEMEIKTVGSTLSFSGPKQVKIGEKFSVDLLLDTTGDPDYTISGVDAVLSLGSSSATPLTTPQITLEEQNLNIQPIPPIWLQPITLSYVSPGKIFDTYPTYPGSQPDQLQSTVSADLKKPIFSNLFTISGVKNYSIDEKGRFQGFTGRGVFATLTFVADKVGKAEIKLVYRGPSVTDDSNINGYLANQPVAGQKTQERLLVSPAPIIIEVIASSPSASKLKWVDIKPEEIQTTVDGKSVGISSLAYGEDNQPIWSDITYEWGISSASSVGSLSPLYGNITTFRPQNAGHGDLFVVARQGSNSAVASIPVTVTSTTICTPRPSCLDDPVIRCLLPEPAGGWCPKATPTPTTSRETIVNFHLQLEGRPNHAISTDIYGMKSSKDITAPEFSRANSVKLGTTTTDTNGYGSLKLDPNYIGQTFYLFAQTSSHLRRAAQNQLLTIREGINPSCPEGMICTAEVKYVEFGQLIAGDIYVDANGYKDNLINSFDIAELFSTWSMSSNDVSKISSADLNGDGIINTRDYAMLISNYGKKGDVSPFGDIVPIK